VRRVPALDTNPFLRRDQSEQVRRSRRRRTLRRRLAVLAGLFGAGLALGTAYAARHYLTHSPRFALRRVDFSEVRHAPMADLRRALDRVRGRNLFLLDLARIEHDLAACRWVRRATVKRVLPDALFAAVEERVPRGLALLRGRVELIDEEGVAIDAYGEKTREFSFPIFTGIDERDAGRAARQAARGVALLDDLGRRRPGLASDISEIDLGRDDRIELHMNEGGPVVRLNPRDFGTNLDHYLAMRDYLATNFGDAAYVDLRFRDRIAFQPLVAKGE
jgi:cell division septal protein FtsQ